MASLARRFWQVFEPIHAVVYFDPGPTDALKQLGAKGFWMSYFAGRFGVLGRVDAAPVVAMAFGFAPAMVARSLPDAWSYVDPHDAVEARTDAAADVLREQLSGDRDVIVELAASFRDAAMTCRTDGRPLAAAWRSVDEGSDPFRRLWVHATVLREHRGDGHVLAAVARGLSGLEAGVTHVAGGAVPRAVIQDNRGWTDGEWDAAVERLVARGVLDGAGGLTDDGAQLRRDIEDHTDELASDPIAQLGEQRIEAAIELAQPLADALLDGGLVPQPNPIGISRRNS